MGVGLARGPPKQKVVLEKGRPIQGFLVGVLLWKLWLHSLYT